MQVQVENLDTLARVMRISLPADRLEDTIKARVMQMSKTANIKGFRPGKVPVTFIQQRYGQAMRMDAANELIRESFSEATRQQKLRPAMAPNVQVSNSPAPGQFEFEARFDILPEIGKVDTTNLDIIKESSEVTAEDLQRMIETLRQQRRTFSPIDRPAANGDMVQFEFQMDVAGLLYPSDAPERAAAILGTGSVMPEIDQGLVGSSAGDEKMIALTLPADYQNSQLAGKSGAAKVKVVAVQAVILPAVDEAFIRSFGVADGSKASFERDIRANLEREMNNALSARLRAEVVNKLCAAYSDFPLPSGLLDMEARSLRAQAMQNARRQGAEINQEPDLALFMEQAAQRVRAGLLLNEIARQNDLRLDARRVRTAVDTIASTYEDPAGVVEMYRKDERLLANVQNRVMEEQVADWVAEHAKSTLQSRSFQQLISG
jgi:trigger factor